MFAFLVAGLILGVLARVLRSGPDDPSMLLTVPAGSGHWSAAWGSTCALRGTPTSTSGASLACLLALVLLGLLEGGIGRK